MERLAIIGTAQSWGMTPWDDHGLRLASLNDAYRLKGFKRADVWYDFHPVDHFYHPPAEGPILAHTIPQGHYCRPTNHLQWLAQQASTIPVYLHPGWREQPPPDPEDRAQWEQLLKAPHVRTFPKAEIEAWCGRYFTSSPAWMFAQALMEGAKEVHIYGIHLATEFEYIKQRPNFEFLCGRLLGAGSVKMTEANGLRRYESQHGLLVLPIESPVLQEDFQYAFEPRPDTGQDPLKWDVHRFSLKRERAIGELKAAKWWQSKKRIREDLASYEAHLTDAQEGLARAKVAASWR